MKTKRQQRAIAAVVFALAALVVTALLLRGRMTEEWNIHRFRTGDEKSKQAALAWMGQNGGETSLLAALEFFVSSDPWTFLIRECKREEPSLEKMMEPLARKRYRELKAAANQRPELPAATAQIYQRLGQEGVIAAFLKVLRRRAGGTRLLISTARAAIVNDFDFPLGPEAIDLAIRRLREHLADPDPLVRSGAVYGLAEAGPRAGMGTIKAISPLLDDPDPVVHEAAVFAINRLSSPGTAEELPK